MKAASGQATIYILLPVHNRRTVTERFVSCLLAQSDRDFQLVLIDDGSTDGTAEAVRSLLSDVVVISGNGRWWWAGSLHQGYRWLQHNAKETDALVLIINDDVIFDKRLLEVGRAALTAQSGSLLLAQLYDQETGEFLEAGARVNWRCFEFESVKTASEANCFSTRGLMMRLDTLFAVGAFRPRMLPHYLSDYEFTLRAQRLGYRVLSRAEFKVSLDQTTTGRRVPVEGAVLHRVRALLSRKSTENPITQTVFILLACPRRLVARSLWIVWRRFLSQSLRLERPRGRS